MNIDKYFDNCKPIFRQMAQVSQYRSVLVDQLEKPYLWGKENQEGSDCSGSVCIGLIGAGWVIRTTADGLLKKIFTEPTGLIEALFYVTKKPTKHGGRTVPAGIAVHIMGFVGQEVVLNMTPPAARLEPESSATAAGKKWGYEVIRRGVSLKALNYWSGKLVAGLDPELKELMHG